MSNADPRGKFVWHELLTTDAAAATAFYTKVVPWKTQSWDQDASYSMWMAKSGPVGGIASVDDTGAPHWLPYVGVEDVDATVAKAQELGASVLKEPTDIPNTGRYAVLADPQGAEFAVYKSSNTYNGAAAPGAGEFTWHELATTDPEAALDFYTQLFGWEAGPKHDMGAEGQYHLFLQDGNQYGGICKLPEGSPSWLCYIGVEDAGKAAAAVKAAGGRILNGPMEVPGGSWVAQVMDQEGVPFAVHEPKIEGAAKPEEEKAAKPSKPKTAKAPKPQKAAAVMDTGSDDGAESNGGAASSVTKPPVTASLFDATADEPAPAAKKPAAKKPAAKKPAAKKPKSAAPAKKSAAGKKSGAKKTAAAKKAPAKAPAKKGPAKKGKKAAAKAKGKAKAPAKKAAAKKTAGKKKSAKRAPAKKKVARKAKKGRR